MSDREHRKAYENTVARVVEHNRRLGKESTEPQVRREVGEMAREHDQKRSDQLRRKGKR